MSAQALARKWRPQNFDTVVGQEHVVQGLKHALSHNRLHHAYLFTGTRGVGKTTLARIFAKCMNCEKGITDAPCGECQACTGIDQGSFLDLIEIDAASRTKVEDTRDLLDNVQYAPTSGRFKVYLIDEVHMLSTHSFNALLKTLEEPPEHVKFLLATTDPQKLPVTVLSRCLQYHLRPLECEQIQTHLADIATKEEIPFEPDALRVIAMSADGSIRDALSLLDQAIAYTESDLKADKLRAMLGLVDETLLYSLVDAVVTGDAKSGMKLAESLFGSSIDFNLLLEKLARFWQQCALMQVLPLEKSEFSLEKLEQCAKALSPQMVQMHYQVCIKAKADLHLAPDQFCGFEMTVLRMLALKPVEIHTPQASPDSGLRENGSANLGNDNVGRETGSVMPKTASSVTESTNKTSMPFPQKRESSEAKTPARASHHAQDSQGWAQTLKQLQLSGITRQLASHLVLDKTEAKKWYFHVEKSHENLLSEQIIRKLAESISTLVGHAVKLEISSASKPAQKSPAAEKKQVADNQLKAAKDAIFDDENVKAIQEAFNATIDGDTITPTSDK